MSVFSLKNYLIAFTLAGILPVKLFSQASFEEKRTTAGNIQMTVNNLGLIGNAFKGSYNILEYSSCEFPINSGVEHLFQGGLWIGTYLDGATVAVSTAAVDDPSGYTTGKSGFEYTAEIGSGLRERSSLVDNPYYDQEAVSHQDFVSDFSDKNTMVPGTTILIGNHTAPLGADVHFESYNYNFNFANYFVILNYAITNNSTQSWDSLYLGFWYDGVVRNVNITPPGGTAFYNKGGNGYIDSLQLSYEFDANGDIGNTESYVALKFLGAEHNNEFIHPLLNPNFKGHFNSWQFQNTADPLYFSPIDDNQRYGKMSQGLNLRTDWETAIRPSLRMANNRSNMLSVGPFSKIAPGETIRIAFAVICAKKVEDGNPNASDNTVQQQVLLQNANFTQTAYNGEDANFNGMLDPGEDRDGNNKITRFILPSPPNSPKLKVISSDHQIDLYWTDHAERSIDPISKKKDFEGYRIYKTRLGFDIGQSQDVISSLKLVAEFDKDSNGLFNNTGFDVIKLDEPLKFEDDTNLYIYHYRFNQIQNGWQHALALTAFDQGDDVNNLASLESSSLATVKRVFPGKEANPDMEKQEPYVYPNPYYVHAAWDSKSESPEDKKIIFSNLPRYCKVYIFTVAGDLVDDFIHRDDYDGSDIRWSDTYSDPKSTLYSGGEHAWDLLSANDQIIARGIYVFAVEDLISGALYQGTFTLIK